MNVWISEEAQRDFKRLPLAIQVRVRSVTRRLYQWPQVSGAKPLSRALAGRYRIRTGDYRIQFRVEPGGIRIERIGHRDGFYE